MIELINGSAHSIPVPGKSVHAVITSPPYFSLRAYAGDQSVDWPEVSYAPMPGMPEITIQPMCCGLGEEDQIEEYIGHLVLCLREWHRILRDDGVCAVNLGDSYSGSGGAGGDYAADGRRAGQPKFKGAARRSALPAKNLCMVPQRFALAAQADGWIARQEIIWAKGVSFLPDYAGSCMPESVRDRPVRGHEQIYMLTKSPKYFWDQDAIKEGLGERTTGRAYDKAPSGRSVRSVWVINPAQYPGAHYAVFPDRLVEPLIKAATSSRGCCSECGTAWARVPQKDADAPQWSQRCDCEQGETIPCTVLDPFVGSGTTVLAAARLGRHGTGVDISKEYLDGHVAARVDGQQIGMSL